MGAQGTATIDFGAFPGKSDASATITGQAGILAGSLVEAWLYPTATTDHSADEHLVETLSIKAGNIVAGTGFTVYAFNSCQINEPLREPGADRNHRAIGTAVQNTGYGANTVKSVGGIGTRIYGQWTIGWVWN